MTDPLLSVLQKRADFLAAAKSGRKWVAPGLILQVNPHPASSPDTPAPKTNLRYGLTATTKIGNAVKRNRARRRLRALAFEVLPLHAALNHDYVLIARNTSMTRDYADLKKDLIAGLQRLKVWREAKP
jgi:ribonuclease P protein component